MKNIAQKIQKNAPLFWAIFTFVIAKILLWDTYFFWDSVSTLSIPAHFLYENRFSSFAFPTNIIDDNILVSSILAGCWTIFGRSLFITHLLFSAIGIALIYQLYRLCRYFVQKKEDFPFIFFLVLSETALVTQSLLIMTDIVILLFSIMAIRYMLEKRQLSFILSLFFLAMVRERGLIHCAGIGLSYYLILSHENAWKKPYYTLKKAILPFIPVIIYFIGFSVYRFYLNDSFHLIRQNTPWVEGREWVDAKLFAINTASLIRYFLDYGKWGIIFTFVFLFFKYGWRNIFSAQQRVLWTLLLCTLGVLALVCLPLNNSFGPRYFILQYIFISLIIGGIIFHLLKRKQAIILCLFLSLGLWSGHFIVYPERVSMGWDATLAHLPYYQLRKDALKYLDENNIPVHETISFFPTYTRAKYIEINNEERTFCPAEKIENANYLLHSNISNSSDKFLDELTENWVVQKEFRKRGVFIRVYHKKM